MVSSRAKTGLSRKIIGFYLAFSLAAVGWLSAALIFTSHALLRYRQSNQLLSRLGKASAAVEMQLLRSGGDGLDSILRDARHDGPSVYWAVVGLDGKYLAHSDRELTGRHAVEPEGVRTRWDEFTGVRYESVTGESLQEYRVALSHGAQPMGELRAAISEPSLLATAQAVAPLAPIAVLAPLGLVLVGGVVVARMSRSVSAIETRLREIAHEPMGAEFDLAPVTAKDAVSYGWNRVVDRLESLGRTRSVGNMAESLADAERQRQDARFEHILQRLSDGIAVTDAEGRIAFANRAIAALLGEFESVDQLMGTALEERILNTTECADDGDLSSPASHCRTAVCEVIQKGGEIERVFRVSRLPLGADPAHGHVWSMRDVTQQRLAEQTRDHFIDTATHELRTPLANIKAYAETLASAEAIDVELQKEFCNIINSEVTRLARFIDDLLSISSMEAGALTIERQKVETDRLFAEVLSKVEPLMQQKQLTFEVDLPPKMPELHLDKDKITAVLVNVLGNAAKYTPDGGRVSLKVLLEDGRLRAAVSDSGVGIAPEEIGKVFEKFFRSDDPRVQAEVGTGLGLSLAREIVGMHGGEITVESVLNQGSTFTVSLPLV